MVLGGTTSSCGFSIAGYDSSGTRQRHLCIVRAHLRVQPVGPAARRVMLGALVEAARTKPDLADPINVAVEELVHRSCKISSLILHGVLGFGCTPPQFVGSHSSCTLSHRFWNTMTSGQARRVRHVQRIGVDVPRQYIA